MLTVSSWHGVTSVVIGNCGTANNVGALVGHSAIRSYALAEEASEREATREEVATMRGLVRDPMSAGALRFATSKAVIHVGYRGKPVPSRLASIDEILQVAGGIVEAGRGGVIQATIGPGLELDEFAELNRATGCTVSWTALLAGAVLTSGDAPTQLARSEAMQRAGRAVVPQVTPRPPFNFEYQLAAPFVFESMKMFRPGRRSRGVRPEHHSSAPAGAETTSLRIAGGIVGITCASILCGGIVSAAPALPIPK